MAEWSMLWTTNGTGDGVSGGYTQAKTTEWMEALFLGDNADEGVMLGYGSALGVTASGGSASPVTIQNGAAMLKGFFYRNDSAGTLNIPTPAGNTRIDRIVLRADWGSQIVRFQRVAGTEGAGTPALTQTDNTTWEIPLATVSITTGGVATVTEGRVYLHPNIQIETSMIADLQVTTAKLAADAVTGAKIADDAVGSAHIAADAIGTAQIQNNAVLTAHIAAEQVTAAKIDNRARTFFVPVARAVDIASLPLDYHAVRGWELDKAAGTAGDNRVYGHGVVPGDYVSGFSARMLLYKASGASGTARLGNEVRYVPTVNGVYTGATAWTGLQPFESAEAQYQSTAVALSGIGAGDTFRMFGIRDAGTASDTLSIPLFTPGWKVSYTADS